MPKLNIIGTGSCACNNKCIQCCKSNPGPTGPPGPTGSTGGPPGPIGPTGPQGVTGMQGSTGNQGNIGPTGVQGPSGHQGGPGLPGPIGCIGPTGAQGHTGVQGFQGETGVQGSQGETGLQGSQGITGMQGFQGETGFQGDRGETGLQGFQGLGLTGDILFVETANSATGPTSSGPIGLEYQDTIRFYSEGGIDLNVIEGSALVNIEPNILFTGNTDPNVSLPSGPEDPTRPATFFDRLTCIIYYWDPSTSTWLTLKSTSLDTEEIKNIVNCDMLGIDFKDIKYKKVIKLDRENEDRYSSAAISGETYGFGKINSSDFGVVELYYENDDENINKLIKQITPSDQTLLSSFGATLDISGNYVVVGSFDFVNDSDPNDKANGRLHVFEKNTNGVSNYGEVTEVFGNTGSPYFGSSVAISGSILVSCEGFNRIEKDLLIFEKNQGGTDNWGLIKTIEGSDGDFEGYSVDVCGSTVVSSFLNLSSQMVAAHVYERNLGGVGNYGLVSTLYASDFTSPDVISVAITNDGVAVSSISNHGIYIYNKVSSTDYAFHQKILTSSEQVDNPLISSTFGSEISLSGSTLAINDSLYDSNKGAIFVYQRNKSNDLFVLQNILQSEFQIPNEYIGFPALEPLINLTGRNKTMVSRNKIVTTNYIKTDNSLDSAGYLYCANYKRRGDTKKVLSLDYETKELCWIDGDAINDTKCSDITKCLQCSKECDMLGIDGKGLISYKKIFANIEPARNSMTISTFYDNFYYNYDYSIDISGDKWVVGSPISEDKINNLINGGAFVYENGSLIKILNNSDVTVQDSFGFDVSISNDTVVVGAPTFENSFDGSVYIYQKNQDNDFYNYGLVKKLKSNPIASSDGFGTTVSVNGNTLFVGAPYDELNSSDNLDHGKVYIYERNYESVDEWELLKTLQPSDNLFEDRIFGYALDISHEYAVIGSLGSNIFNIYHRNTGGCNNWGLVQTIDLTTVPGSFFTMASLKNIITDPSSLFLPRISSSVEDKAVYNDVEFIQSFPAVAYTTPLTAFNTTQTTGIFYLRASDSMGCDWDSSAVVTVDPTNDAGLNGLSMIQQPNGFPAIAYESSGMLKYITASDNLGSTWPSTPVTLDSGDVGYFPYTLQFNSNDIGISYINELTNDLRFIFSSDSGTSWSTPYTVAPSDNSNNKKQTIFTSVSSNPAIAFIDKANQQIKYVRASDTIGTMWPNNAIDVANITITNSETYPFGFATIDNVPALAYYDSGSLKYIRASDTLGNTWPTTPQTVDTSGDAGKYATLLEDSSNLPVIGYFSDSPSFEARLAQGLDVNGINWNLNIAASNHGNLASTIQVGSQYGMAIVNSSDTSYDFALVTLEQDENPNIKNVAIDKNYLALGVPSAVYVYQRTESKTWLQKQILSGSTVSFGRNVDVSGQTIVVGEIENSTQATNAGSVHVYQINSTTDTWELQNSLYTPIGNEGDNLGASVAISGNKVVAGATTQSSDVGFAMYYSLENKCASSNKKVLSLDYDTHELCWIDGKSLNNVDCDKVENCVKQFICENNIKLTEIQNETRIDSPEMGAIGGFGTSVDLSGNNFVVGNNIENKAYVYNETELIKELNATDDLGFGTTVSITYDVVAVSEPQFNTNQGLLYIYHKDEGGLDNYGLITTIESPEPQDNSFFALRHASSSGNRIIVGQSQYSTIERPVSGLAHIYYRNKGSENGYGLVKTLVPTVLDYNLFGSQVDIAGSVATVSQPGNDPDIGRVYVYQQDLGGIDQWGLLQILEIPETFELGTSLYRKPLALTENVLVVSTFRDDFLPGSGPAIYIYERSKNNAEFVFSQKIRNGSVSDDFGAAVSVSQMNISVSFPSSGDGIIYLYQKNNVSLRWEEVNQITGTTDNTTLGSDLSLSGNKLVAIGSALVPTDPGVNYYVFESKCRADLKKVLTLDDECNQVSWVDSSSLFQNGAGSLDLVSDVNITGASDNDTLSYDANASEWINQPAITTVNDGVVINGTNIQVGNEFVNTPSERNIAMGVTGNKGFNYGTGKRNVAIGNDIEIGNVGQTNLTGDDNVFIGNNLEADDGDDNKMIYIGSDLGGAGNSVLIGNDCGMLALNNILIGLDNGNLTTSNGQAVNNCGIGLGNLTSNTEGNDNVFVGRNNLTDVTTGNFNVGVGNLNEVLSGTTSESTLVGYNNQGNTNDVLVGRNSIFNGSSCNGIGFNLYTGSGSSNNIYLGHDLGTTSFNASNNIAIGINSLSNLQNSDNYNISVGNFNDITLSSNSLTVGHSNSIDNADDCVIVGDSNTIADNNNQSTIIGHDNTCDLGSVRNVIIANGINATATSAFASSIYLGEGYEILSSDTNGGNVIAATQVSGAGKFDGQNVVLGSYLSIGGTLNYSVLVGAGNTCQGLRNTTIGTANLNNDDNSVVIGHNMTSIGDDCVTIGSRVASLLDNQTYIATAGCSAGTRYANETSGTSNITTQSIVGITSMGNNQHFQCRLSVITSTGKYSEYVLLVSSNGGGVVATSTSTLVAGDDTLSSGEIDFSHGDNAFNVRNQMGSGRVTATLKIVGTVSGFTVSRSET